MNEDGSGSWADFRKNRDSDRATIERSRGEGSGEVGVVVDASAIAFSKVTVEFSGDPPAAPPALAERGGEDRDSP